MKLKYSMLAAAMLLPVQAYAQEEDGNEPHSFEGPGAPQIIVTANGVETELRKTGQSVTVLENVSERPFSDLGSLLATTPGVSMTSNGPIGGFSAVRIRGAEGEQTLTLIDGVRVNDPSSPGGGFDFGNLLLGNIEKVEILRGPNSVPWGSKALGGVINISTARPEPGFGGTLKAEYGSNDRTVLAGNVGQKSDRIAISAGGGIFRDDGVSAYKTGTEPDGYRQYAANGRVEFSPFSSLTLSAGGFYAKSKTDLDGFPPPNFSFADTPQFSRIAELYGYSSAKVSLADQRFVGRLTYSFADVNRDNFDTPGQNLPSFLARGRSGHLSFQGDLAFTPTMRVVVGLEREKARFNDGFQSVRTHTNSAYAQAIFAPIYPLNIALGARIDDHREFGSKTTLSASLSYKVAPNTRVRLAYGEGFKAPTLFQLFSFFGNETLQPEQAKSYELGLVQEFAGGKVGMSATAFMRSTSGQINFISCFGQTAGICLNRPFGTYDNIDRTRARGVEAGLWYHPSDGLSIDANYSLIKAENRTDGLQLLRRPKHSLHVQIEWQASSWLRLGSQLQSVSKSADVDFITFDRTTLGGYTVVKLYAKAMITKRIEFFGRIENLFDERYELVSGYGTYGRNFHAGLRMKF